MNSLAENVPAAPAARRRPPILGLILTLTGAGLLVLFGRLFAPLLDRAIGNIVTLIGAFIALVGVLIWIAFRSGLSPLVRLLVPLSIVGSIVVAAVCVRIDETTGTMVPVLRWRWTPKADRVLAKPTTTTATEENSVDLTTVTPEDFPQFLGPDRHPVLPGPRLARDWQASPPRRVWSQDIGAGWSAFSVVNGFAVTMEQRGDDELVTCYEVQTGKLRWSHAEKTRHETLLGGVGPRSTPTIADGHVYALGGTGIVRCLDGATGKLLWRFDILGYIGSTPEKDMQVVAWGRANSPLVVNNLVVVPLGGPPGGPFISLAALDRQSGEIVWVAGDQQVSYASPVATSFDGQLQILVVNEASVTGHNPADGQLLWENPWDGSSNSSASASQPVPLPGNDLLISKGYGVGASLWHLARADDKWAVSERWSANRVLRTKLTNVAVRDGHAYGLNDGILECVELATGRSRWKRGRYEHGQILLVGDLLLVLTESGEVALVEAVPDAHRELGRIQAIEGKTWNNVCLTGRYLLVRNGQKAACWELPVESE